MAKNNRLLIGAATIGLGFLAYKTWSVKRSLQMFDYSISNVSFRFSGLTPVLYFKLLIYNPNKQAIPVNDIVGQVFFKGFDAGTFHNRNPVKIGANQKAAIDMQARLKPGEIIQALLKKTAGGVVNIEGIMRTSLVDMPFSYKWDFTKKVSGIGAANPNIQRIAKYGISYNNRRIAKLEKEIKEMEGLRNKTKNASTLANIDYIININLNKISSIQSESQQLRKRL